MSANQPRRANGQFAASPRAAKAPKPAPFRPTANPELAKAMQEIRRSGAAGTHGDRRTKRLRTRGSQKAQSIREQSE